MDNSKGSKIIGYVAVLMSCVTYAGSVITSQILGRTYPRFELNFIRFCAQTTVVFILVLVLKIDKLYVKGWRDSVLLFISSTCYMWEIYSLNLAPLYAPVGNLESVGMTVVLILNLLFSCVRCKASLSLSIAAGLTIVGVGCLTQPEFVFGESDASLDILDPCPCSLLQGDTQMDKISECLTNDMNHYDWLEQNTTYGNATMNRTGNTVIQSTHSELNSETIGYLLIISMGFTFFMTLQINANFLLQSYHYAVVTVWHALIGALYSLIFMFIFEKPRFVGGLVCLSTLGIHALFASGTFLLVRLGLMYVSVEEFGIVSTSAIVMLFIAQSTVLSDFHPPKGNIWEYLGAILIIVACVLEPLDKLIRKKCEQYKKAKRQEVNEKTPLCE